MIRTTAAPRPVRAGAAAVGVAGILALAGCAASAADADDSQPADELGAEESAGAADEGTDDGTADGAGAYRDGTYTAEGSYQTPESIETITVTVTLEDDVITAVEVVGNPTKRESEQYQGQFIGGIADVVVGKGIDEISVSRVAGSSLTSGGFNRAIDEIRSEAAG